MRMLGVAATMASLYSAYKYLETEKFRKEASLLSNDELHMKAYAALMKIICLDSETTVAGIGSELHEKLVGGAFKIIKGVKMRTPEMIRCQILCEEAVKRGIIDKEEFKEFI